MGMKKKRNERRIYSNSKYRKEYTEMKEDIRTETK